MKKIDRLSIPQKFSEIVVRFRWVFFGIFIALTIACVVLIPYTKVEYDLSGYLPAKSETAEAMTVLKEQFDDKGMAYVMVKGVTEEEAAALALELNNPDKGIAAVTYAPEMGNYKNGNALYTVNLKDYDSTAGAFDAVEWLIDTLDSRDAYFAGQSASSFYTRQSTEDSILTIGIVIVVAIILMLLFTSKSYFELLLMVAVLGVSVALNMGTNYFFNGISYISNLVSLVLQLALSIDYSVILLHRFMEERTLNPDAKKAAVTALTKAIPEICSSSLTTIAGMCALMFMSLKIGVEIGISLTKGIVFSLLSVILLMPALLVIFAKPLDKTKHKSFVPNVTKPARAIVKARKVIVPIFLVLVILAGTGQFYNTYAFNMNGCAEILASQEEIGKDFGSLNSLVVIVPKGDYEKQRAVAEYVTSFEQVSDQNVNALSTIQIAEGVGLTDSFSRESIGVALKGLAAGTGVSDTLIEVTAQSCFDNYLESAGITPTADTEVTLLDLLVYINGTSAYDSLLGDYKPMLSQLVFAKDNLESEDYARMTFMIDSGVENKETFALLTELKEGLKDYYSEFYLTGESVVCYEMAEFFPADNTLVNVFTLVFILLILLFTFKNLALPVILTLAIQGGIWINFVIPFLAGNTVCFIGYLIIMAVQMGATIDYAIVLTNRYKTTKHNFPDRYSAMAASENAVFPTIITSGIILTITGFALAIASSGVVAELGSLLGIGALASVMIVLFVLPSLLLVTEKVSDKLDFKLIFRRKGKKLADAAAEDGDTSCNIDASEATADNCEEGNDILNEWTASEIEAQTVDTATENADAEQANDTATEE